MEALAATIGRYDCRHYEIPSIMAVITTKSSELKPSLHIAMHSSTPGQNGGRFADDVFRWIFMNEKFCILIKISLKFVPKGSIDNIPALWQWLGANQATSHYLDHWVMIFFYWRIYASLGLNKLTSTQLPHYMQFPQWKYPHHYIGVMWISNLRHLDGLLQQLFRTNSKTHQSVFPHRGPVMGKGSLCYYIFMCCRFRI